MNILDRTGLSQQWGGGLAISCLNLYLNAITI